MNDTELRDLVARLRAEADRIEACLSPSQPAADPYYTSVVPCGWDTVLGYLAKTNPEALRNLDEYPEATLRDGYWLKHRCTERGIRPVKVPACEFLRGEHGIEQVNAYPVALLEERLG